MIVMPSAHKSSKNLNYPTDDVFCFLQEMMGVQIALPEGLFSDHSVSSTPNSFSWESTFASSQPPGDLKLRFATGQANNVPSIVWETTFRSTGDDVPTITETIGRWIDGAHDIVNDCFFRLIDGDLERRFSGG